jgi:5'-nucleotidase
MSIRSLFLASSALALTAVPASAFTLHVLHINDFHSRIQSINGFNSTCSDEDETAGECFGGAARLHTAINALRDELVAAGENVIVVDAGDQFMGSLFFTTFSGAAEQEFMNGIGFDAMVVGNHEFDLGPEPLLKFVEGAEFPVIFGNADVSGDNMLAPLDRDSVILEVGGERIGILGVVAEDTAETSSPGPGVSFVNAADTLAAGVAALEAEGVDKIIALTHVGVPRDLELAASVEGLDAIVGGHSHTLFSNTVEGAPPYPVMAEAAGGGTVPIVQAGAYSKYLGHLVLEFDDAGVVTAASGDTILMDASVTPDEGVLARIAEKRGPIDELMGRVVAEIEGDIDGSRETCRSGECQMGNLVADALLDRVADQGVTIAIQNGGGLRASIGGPQVTKGEVLTVLPFQNTLATFNLSGAGIVGALENGFSEVEEGAGRFPQVSGLKVVWNPAAEPGDRVVEVMVRDGEAWAPIDPAATYTVATNNFMRRGGDGYSVMSEQGENAYDFGPNLEDVVSDYLAARPGYVPFTDGRITTVE